MGRATSCEKSLICLPRSGQARVVEFDMDQTCRRPGRSTLLVGSGLAESGRSGPCPCPCSGIWA